MMKIMPPELMDMPGTPMPIGKSNAMPGLSAPVDEADGLSSRLKFMIQN